MNQYRPWFRQSLLYIIAQAVVFKERPPNHGLEATGLISALFNCSTRFGVARLAKVVSRIRPAAKPNRWAVEDNHENSEMGENDPVIN